MTAARSRLTMMMRMAMVLLLVGCSHDVPESSPPRPAAPEPTAPAPVVPAPEPAPAPSPAVAPAPPSAPKPAVAPAPPSAPKPAAPKPAAPKPAAHVDEGACTSDGDCMIYCPHAAGCCSSSCGCKNAINRAAKEQVDREFTASCIKPPHCLAEGCAYQPALSAVCESGRCRALSGPGFGTAPPGRGPVNARP